MSAANAFDHAIAVKDVDIRGFAYALEPLCQRQRWQLDTALAELACAQRQLDETETRLSRLRKAHDAEALALLDATTRRIDPAARYRALAHLAHLGERAKQLEAQRDAQRRERDARRSDCIARQLRLDGLAKHKQDALADYANEARRRLANEQDRDWLAHRVASPGPGTRPKESQR